MTRRLVWLRQRLDVMSGLLLLCAVTGSCLALEVARRARQDVVVSNALAAQQRMIDDALQLEDPQRALELLEPLEANFRIFATGGRFQVGEATFVLPAQEGSTFRQPLANAQEAMSRHLHLFQQAHQARQLNYTGQELRLAIQELAAAFEQDSLASLIRSSQWQLVCIVTGLALFVVWVLVIRRLVTTPLHRMAERIETMQRTGHLVKLPVIHRDEIGVIALGFNHLSEQVEEQKRRLREHIVDLQRANAELEEMGKLKDDFLSTISHQLRTPMTAMLGALELLRDGVGGTLPQAQQELTRTVHSHATRVADLIEKALSLSLVKSGRRALKCQPDDLAALLRHIQAEWKEVATQPITLACETLPKVFIDAQAIRNVLDQLLSNALRHAPAESEVELRVRVLEGMVEVSVHDHGSGLSQEQLAHLFEPFAHVTTPDAPGSQGSGLGLAYCRQIIERHHGAIRADAPESGGTIVTFTVPLATPSVMFVAACRVAEEEAEYEDGQYGLVYVAPDPLVPRDESGRMRQAELVLRRSTHRGDQFVWLDDHALLIIAVADRAGLRAMAERLAQVLERASLPVRLSSALYPVDGSSPDRLLETARTRFFEHAWAGHATMSAVR